MAPSQMSGPIFTEALWWSRYISPYRKEVIGNKSWKRGEMRKNFSYLLTYIIHRYLVCYLKDIMTFHNITSVTIAIICTKYRKTSIISWTFAFVGIFVGEILVNFPIAIPPSCMFGQLCWITRKPNFLMATFGTVN